MTATAMAECSGLSGIVPLNAAAPDKMLNQKVFDLKIDLCICLSPLSDTSKKRIVLEQRVDAAIRRAINNDLHRTMLRAFAV